jgi:hypothetical protein
MEGLAAELAAEMVKSDTPFPVAVVILAITTITQLGVLAKIFLPVWMAKMTSYKNGKSEESGEKGIVKKSKPDALKDFLDKDGVERQKRQAEVDNRFNRIEAHIEQTSKNIEHLDVVISGVVNTVDELSYGALENRLFTKAAPAVRRLRAFKRLIALKNNGPVKVVGVDLAADNPDTWFYVLSEPLNMNIVDQGFFDGVVEEINTEIRKRAENEE